MSGYCDPSIVVPFKLVETLARIPSFTSEKLTPIFSNTEITALSPCKESFFKPSTTTLLPKAFPTRKKAA